MFVTDPVAELAELERQRRAFRAQIQEFVQMATNAAQPLELIIGELGVDKAYQAWATRMVVLLQPYATRPTIPRGAPPRGVREQEAG